MTLTCLHRVPTMAQMWSQWLTLGLLTMSVSALRSSTDHSAGVSITAEHKPVRKIDDIDFCLF